MTKRVFIVHGWDGNPEEGIFPWLKNRLEQDGFLVYNPAMPDPLNPKIETWIPFLAQQVGVPDAETHLLGHSIGAQAILRYLESLPEGQGVGGVVLLAGWVNLTDEAYEDESDVEIGKPWIETPIRWEVVRQRAKKFTAIFSDDDSLVPLNDAGIFKKNLGAEIIIEHGKGHFSGSDGIIELPSALEAIENMRG